MHCSYIHHRHELNNIDWIASQKKKQQRKIRLLEEKTDAML